MDYLMKREVIRTMIEHGHNLSKYKDNLSMLPSEIETKIQEFYYWNKELIDERMGEMYGRTEFDNVRAEYCCDSILIDIICTIIFLMMMLFLISL